MKPERPSTMCVLIDLQYYASINAFEEWYGDHISYQELEQSSYIEFKELMFENISRGIKFRKYGRIGNVLTLKADMLKLEIEKFKNLLEKNDIKLIHGWVVSNVTIITDKLLDKGGNEEEDEEDEDGGFNDFDDI
jgi:hypothetical protein